jgi:hypothetical protein
MRSTYILATGGAKDPKPDWHDPPGAEGVH